MTQDEIIEMAKQAGYKDLPTVRLAYQGFDKEKFAKLVAEAAASKAVEREREACAKICDNKQYVHPYHDLGTLIRARGETK